MTLTRISASFLPILPEARGTRAAVGAAVAADNRICSNRDANGDLGGIICELADYRSRCGSRLTRIGQFGWIFWRIAMLIVAPVDARARSGSR